MFGVRLFCGIHIICSGAVIRGDRQGLLSGKFEASRCGTHLLLAGSPIAEVRHKRIILKMTRTVFHRPFVIYAEKMMIAACVDFSGTILNDFFTKIVLNIQKKI